MQRVRQRRGKLTKAKPDLAKEKAALHRVLGEAPIPLEAARPAEFQEISSRGAFIEQLRDRLDRWSGPSAGRPCPVDPSKCLHELRVDEDVLYFPFEPLSAQKAVASYSIKACDRGGIAFLESPTGTGKSLALLCAVLAWQRRHAGAAPTVPQIVYGVRTHSQIKQIVGELRKCGYRPRMAVIGSREQLCANETVKSQAKSSRTAGASLNLSCRHAARCAVAELPGGCQLYRGLGQNSYAQRVHDRYGQAGRIWDVEELLSCAQPGAGADQIAGCPYYTAHVLAGDADIVFCPQNYILDPSVSQCRSHHRERWSLKGRIVIIDEAHNVETCCREAGSVEISTAELWQMNRTLRRMPLRHSKLRFGERRSCAQAAEELEKLPLQLCAFLGRHRTPTSSETSTSPLDRHVLWGLGSTSTTKLFLQQCGLAPSGLLSKTMEELAIEAVDRLLQAQLNESSTDAEDAELLAALEKLRDLIFKLRLAHKHSDSYVVAVQPGDATRLCLWLMSPGVLFEVFASQAHCVLLASGTLAPLGALQAELMASEALASRALREGPLEARHIVHPWQLFAAVLPCADHCNAPIVSTYGNWQSEEFVQAVGASVLRLVSCIPGGVLCFLPSYQSLDLALLFWRRSGLWQDLAKVKVLVTEPRQASEMPEAVRRFMTGVGEGPGALCFAVYRGKMSEGLDFTDDLCRAVICIGVPYPQMNDPVVVAKRRWNDATRGGLHGRLSGDQWYELQAHRAVNQALGRLLRHGRDYGALILLDARWAQRGQKARNLRAKLSGWIQRHLVDWPCSTTGLSGNVFGRLTKHFQDAARRPLPALPLPQPEVPAVPTPMRCEAGAPRVPGLATAKRRFVDTLEGSKKPALTFTRMESTWSPALPLAYSQE